MERFSLALQKETAETFSFLQFRDRPDDIALRDLRYSCSSGDCGVALGSVVELPSVR